MEEHLRTVIIINKNISDLGRSLGSVLTSECVATGQILTVFGEVVMVVSW